MTAAPPVHRRPGPGRRRGPVSRRERLTGRALPIAVLALVAFVAGVVLGARHEPAARLVVERFLAAWERGDHGGMYQLLSAQSRSREAVRDFVAAYRQAAETATIRRVRPGEPTRTGDAQYATLVAVETRRFGTLRGRVVLEVETGSDGQAGVRFDRTLVFPGLRPGETLGREIVMPRRGTIEARDGRAIAEGADRTSELGSLAAEIAGRVGPIPPEEADAYRARGYPPDAVVGLTGLERQFETRLAGTFGGTLRAGGRVLARTEPRPAGPVRTSIDPDIEAATVAALGGRYGGVAVLRPRTGEVLALAGIAYSAPQPPGSTFKIITLAGALDAKIVKSSATFPVETATTLSGVRLENAHGEACGGSLELSFAHSCNTVFAPLGAKLGAARLVAAAERFGFNDESEIPGAPTGSIPSAQEIGDDLAVGSSAIGQGRVTSTPLRMAEVAAAIANGGRLVRPTMLRGERGESKRATSHATARIIRRFMLAVVERGTGAAAAIPGVRVAGKTGTAELRDTVPDEGDVESGEAGPDPDDTTDTDAWFVAFAPAHRPKVAVAVLLVGQGAGGDTAAPVARAVLEAALKR